MDSGDICPKLDVTVGRFQPAKPKPALLPVDIEERLDKLDKAMAELLTLLRKDTIPDE